MIIRHLIERAAAEVRWHEELLGRMPKIAADFEAGIGARQQRRQAPRRRPRDHRAPGRPDRATAAPAPRRARLAGRLDRAGRRLHGAARHHDRQRGAAQHPDRAARLLRQPGMDRGRLRAGLRAGPGARRAGRRPVRPQAPVPHRPDHLHPGQRGLRPLAEPGRDRHRPGRAGLRRRGVLPGHRRHHPAVLHRAAALQGVRRAGRDHRRLDRAGPAARRPDHRGCRGQRRLALGVPGQPVHRRGHGPAGGLAAAPLGRAGPARAWTRPASPC